MVDIVAAATRKFVPPGRRGGFGRQKGVPNKNTAVKRDLKRFLEDPVYQNNVMARIEAGVAPHLEKYFWEFVYGRPKFVIETPVPPQTSSLAKALLTLSKSERMQLAEISRKVVQARVVDVRAIPEKAVG